MPYLITFAVLGLMLLLLTALLVKSMLTSIYRYRNIVLIGAMAAATLLLSYIVVFGILSDPNTAGWQELTRHLARAPRDFAHGAIWVVCTLGLLMFISNLSLAKHEGINPLRFVGTMINAANILGTLIAYTLAHLLDGLGQPGGEILTNADLPDNPIVRFCAEFIPLFFYCMLDYVELLMFAMIILGLVAAYAKPVYDKDYIIILGCSISKDGGLLPLLKGRTNKAVHYAWEQEIATGKKVCYVPSGGKGGDEVMSEGSAMEIYLLSHGAEADEVYAEKQSRNTWENFKYSKALIDDLKEDARVAFSTTNYHVLRSGMLAKKAGFRHVEGIASSTKWYYWPNGFAREVIAILSMNLRWHIFAIVVIAILCAGLVQYL